MFTIATEIEQFKNSDITRESKSRAGKTTYDYHLDSPDGRIRGKTNTLNLVIPQILIIAERLESGESLSQIHRDYADIISITSMSETMKKYYAGLFDRVIKLYVQYRKVKA
jgi:hypothetical protein